MGFKYNRIVNFSFVVTSWIGMCSVQLYNVIVQTQKSLPSNVVYGIFPSYLTVKLEPFQRLKTHPPMRLFNGEHLKRMLLPRWLLLMVKIFVFSALQIEKDHNLCHPLSGLRSKNKVSAKALVLILQPEWIKICSLSSPKTFPKDLFLTGYISLVSDMPSTQPVIFFS